jgi:predicted HicB family RNase H-like nuclease
MVKDAKLVRRIGEELGKPVQLKVLVSPLLHRALKVYAAESGDTMNALVSKAVTALLKQKGAL